MVENLGNPDGGQVGVPCLDEKLDRCGGGFALDLVSAGIDTCPFEETFIT